MRNRLITGLFFFTVVISSTLPNSFIVEAQDGSPTPAPTIDATPTAMSTPKATVTAVASISQTVEPAASASTDGSGSSLGVAAIDLINLGISALIFFVFYRLGGKLVIAVLRRIAKRSPSEFVDQLIELIAPGIANLVTVLGLQIATLRLDFIDGSLRSLLQNIYFVLYWYIFVKIFWDLISFLTDWYFDHADKKDQGGMFERLRPLLKRVSRIVIGFLGVVILLSHFGVNVITIMAALGLGGFALALAAKDTITNIISGFVIMITQPFKVGDRIEISAIDAWADVSEIGYRSTTCVTRDNREVIVPNGNIVDNTIINYSLPDPSYRLQQDMGISEDMDILKVVKVLKETVSNTEGVMKSKPVDILFTEYGESTMNIRVRWWVENYGDKRSVTHRVMSAIQEAAEKENIDMPNPAFVHDTSISMDTDELNKISSIFSQSTSSDKT